MISHYDLFILRYFSRPIVSSSRLTTPSLLISKVLKVSINSFSSFLFWTKLTIKIKTPSWIGLRVSYFFIIYLIPWISSCSLNGCLSIFSSDYLLTTFLTSEALIWSRETPRPLRRMGVWLSHVRAFFLRVIWQYMRHFSIYLAEIILRCFIQPSGHTGRPVPWREEHHLKGYKEWHLQTRHHTFNCTPFWGLRGQYNKTIFIGTNYSSDAFPFSQLTVLKLHCWA